MERASGDRHKNELSLSPAPAQTPRQSVRRLRIPPIVSLFAGYCLGNVVHDFDESFNSKIM